MKLRTLNNMNNRVYFCGKKLWQLSKFVLNDSENNILKYSNLFNIKINFFITILDMMMISIFYWTRILWVCPIRKLNTHFRDKL